MVYLDNAATTKIDPDVIEAMIPYMKNMYGNAGSQYKIGRESKRAIDDARKSVAELINAEPEQIIFTSGGTESNSSVVRFSNFPKDKKTILCSTIEHDSVIRSAHDINSWSSNYKYKLIPVLEDGRVDPETIRSMLSDDVGIVSVMYVNNETGVVNPVAEIGDLLSSKGIKFHTDCVQALSCCSVNVKDINCDFASMSSHKIHGPKGVGALYVKDPSKFNPLIIGGRYQEHGLRGGTENVAGIVGFGKACEIQNRYKNTSFYGMKCKFETILGDELKRLNCNVEYFVNGNSCGKVINITFRGVDGESLVLMLDAVDVCISSGSACRSHETKPSHVLKAMGLSDEDAHNSVRVSFSRLNSLSDIEIGAKEMARCVNMLSNIR